MTEYVTTNIRLPRETYRELKQRALDAETSLAEVVRESVAEYLVTATPPENTSADFAADPYTLRESSITAYAVTAEGLAPRLVLEPQLYSRVAQAAGEHKIGMDRLLADALRRYLWELDRRKISEESRTYQQRHAELKAQYLGQYIAMCDGQVVDHDMDAAALRKHVRQRFGRKPVMITLVEEVAERPFARHGFRMEAVQP